MAMHTSAAEDDGYPIQRTVSAATAPRIQTQGVNSPFALGQTVAADEPARPAAARGSGLSARAEQTLRARGWLTPDKLAEALGITRKQAANVGAQGVLRGYLVKRRSGRVVEFNAAGKGAAKVPTRAQEPSTARAEVSPPPSTTRAACGPLGAVEQRGAADRGWRGERAGAGGGRAPARGRVEGAVMSISVRQTRQGVSIRTTGADAERVLRNIAAALAPQGPADAPEGLPKPSKAVGRTNGVTEARSVRVALQSREAR